MQPTEQIWMNGELVPWDDARIHVGAHGLHYGTGVFEGIRCYDTPKGPAIFRLSDHMQRLHASEPPGVSLHPMLAVSEAQRAGYDEAIMLTPEGTVADGPGETIFVVRAGTLYTPDLSTGILHGITRDSVIQLARELGYDV